MPANNNKIQSFTANSSVATDGFTGINIISRWCVNRVQPSITQMNKIETILDVDVRNLITPTK